MVDQEVLIPCSSCGRPQARSDMFGVEPELLCQSCRDGVSKRMHVRFRPQERDHPPIVTKVCLGICVALYLATHIFFPWRPDQPPPGWLQALYQAEPIWSGQVWRHVSCIFLHANWLHLGMNALWLWFLGRYVEIGWGHWAMVGLVLITGVTAAAVSWIMTTPGSVGISGVVYGLIAFLIAMRHAHPVARAVMHERNVKLILTLMVVGFVVTSAGNSNIDHWAHGVGFVMGWLVAVAIRQGKSLPRLVACVALSIALIVTSVFVAFGSGIPMQRTNQYGEQVETFTITRQEYRTWWLHQQETERPGR